MTPITTSPMPFSWSSSVTSPVAISLMPDLSRPRSTNCLTNCAPAPDGTQTNSGSGLGSSACRLGGGGGDRLLRHRREAGAAQRHAQAVDDGAAVGLELLAERFLGVDA